MTKKKSCRWSIIPPDHPIAIPHLPLPAVAVPRPPALPPPTVTVALKDIGKVCTVCGSVDPTTHQRTYYPTSYQGPCGDSFCYASCDLISCRGFSGRACDSCAKEKKEPLR